MTTAEVTQLEPAPADVEVGALVAKGSVGGIEDDATNLIGDLRRLVGDFGHVGRRHGEDARGAAQVAPDRGGPEGGVAKGVVAVMVGVDDGGHRQGN